MSPEPSIREFDVEYRPTIAQDANREVERGYEIHLRIIRVQVRIGSAGQDSTTFEVVFKADHEGHAVEFHSVGDAYDNETAFRPEEIMLATEVARLWSRSYHTTMQITTDGRANAAIGGSCTGDVISFSFSEVPA